MGKTDDNPQPSKEVMDGMERVLGNGCSKDLRNSIAGWLVCHTRVGTKLYTDGETKPQ